MFVFTDYIVPAKCPNCGVNLHVNSYNDDAVCENCKTAFITEKAVNNYNMTNNKNTKTNGINVFKNNAADFTVLAGILKKYNGETTKVVIPENITCIGNSVFEGCTGLISVLIPNSVTSIGDRAFAGCTGLTDVIIPNSVTSIGAGAFDGCSGLTATAIQKIQKKYSMAITDFIIQYGTLIKYNGTAEKVIIPSGVTGIGDRAFARCTGLTGVIIPNGVSSIGAYAFYKCFRLTDVSIPNSVTCIGEYAFSGCSGLTDAVIPNGVRIIEGYAFAGCSNLTAVTIPESVTNILNGAFIGCRGLTDIIIPHKTICIDSLAFHDCSKLKYIKIRFGVKFQEDSFDIKPKRFF